MKNKISALLVIIIFALITTGVYINQLEKLAIDQSKIPAKVEESGGFQRWITNLKNNEFIINADEFSLIEENEIYNTKWMTIKSVDQNGVLEEFEKEIEAKKDKSIRDIAFSPSNRQFVDYRSQERDINPNTNEPYKANEIHYLGLRDDKVIDARFLDCSVSANCYFDRAWFLEDSNDIFVVSEFSLANTADGERDKDSEKGMEEDEVCTWNDVCTYTIKLHVIDLITNSRLVYVSNPFDLNFNEIVEEL